MTKQHIYEVAYGAVEGAMRAVGFPVSMSTGRDIEHIAHRVADAIYTVMRLEGLNSENRQTIDADKTEA